MRIEGEGEIFLGSKVCLLGNDNKRRLEKERKKLFGITFQKSASRVVRNAN